MKQKPQDQLVLRLFSLAIAFSLLLQPVGLVRAQDAKPATYEGMLAKANALLKEGKNEEALTAAKEAARSDTRRFEAFALAALTLHRLGKSAEAQEFLAKALALAPEDKQARLQDMAKAMSAPPTPTPAKPAEAKALDPEARVKLDLLMLLAQDADRARTPVERKRALREFLAKSAPFVKAYPSEVGVWVLRATAAIEMDYERSGRAAAQKLKTLVGLDSEDVKIRTVMAALSQKGWLESNAASSPELIFEFMADGQIRGTPAVGADGTIYIVSSSSELGKTDGGKVFAVNRSTGEARWSFQTGGPINSSPIVGPTGLVYVGSTDKKIYALNGQTGEKVWEFAFMDKALYATSLTNTFVELSLGRDGAVFVGMLGIPKLYALNSTTGSILWGSSVENGFFGCHTLTVGNDDTIYVSSMSGCAAVNGKNGKKLWSSVSGVKMSVNGTSIDAGIQSVAIRSDGSLLYGTMSGLCAAGSKNGKNIWKFLDGLTVMGAAADTNESIYVASIGYWSGSKIESAQVLYSVDGKTGAKKWEFPSAAGHPAVGDDDTVYVGSTENKFLALDGKSGRPKWTFGVDGTGSCPPSIGPDGTVYFGTDTGIVYGLKTTSSGPAKSSWPMHKANAQQTGRAAN